MSNRGLHSNDFMGFHASTMVVFADGRSASIKDVVNQQIEGKVWSYNEESGEFEEHEIIGWHYNGKIEKIDDYVYLETTGIDCNRGRFGFAATKNCQVMTYAGWKTIEDVAEGDEILTKYRSIVNGTVGNFLWGTMIGDCTVKQKEENRYNLQFVDNVNPDYLRWKVDKLSSAFNFKNGYCGGCDSNFSFELKLIKEELGRRDPCAMLMNHYSDMGLAVWYMDDGTLCSGPKKRASISVKRFANNRSKLDEIARLLCVNGVPCSYIVYGCGDIIFKGDKLKNLLSRVCRYVPESMQYKLLDEYRGESYKGKYQDFELSHSVEMKRHCVPVVLVRQISDRQFESNGKYMISTALGNVLIGNPMNGIVAKCGSTAMCKFGIYKV